MDRGKLISAHEFCARHSIEFSFIDSLRDEGLVEITKVEESEYISEDQLNDLERIVRLHYDLDINIEGIETIMNLLQRIGTLQDEITFLRNRLRLYESSDF